jgi:hypothetical protein
MKNTPMDTHGHSFTWSKEVTPCFLGDFIFSPLLV